MDIGLIAVWLILIGVCVLVLTSIVWAIYSICSSIRETYRVKKTVLPSLNENLPTVTVEDLGANVGFGSQYPKNLLKDVE